MKVGCVCMLSWKNQQALVNHCYRCYLQYPKLRHVVTSFKSQISFRPCFSNGLSMRCGCYSPHWWLHQELVTIGILLLSFQALGANKTIGPFLVETHISFWHRLCLVWLNHSITEIQLWKAAKSRLIVKNIKIIYLSLYCPALQGWSDLTVQDLLD